MFDLSFSLPDRQSGQRITSASGLSSNKEFSGFLAHNHSGVSDGAVIPHLPQTMSVTVLICAVRCHARTEQGASWYQAHLACLRSEDILRYRSGSCNMVRELGGCYFRLAFRFSMSPVSPPAGGRLDTIKT